MATRRTIRGFTPKRLSVCLSWLEARPAREKSPHRHFVPEDEAGAVGDDILEKVFGPIAPDFGLVISLLERLQHPAGDVAGGDDADQASVVVDHRQPAHGGAGENAQRTHRGLAFAHAEQLGAHVLPDGGVQGIFFQSMDQILDADDAGQVVARQHGQPRDAVIADEVADLADRGLRGHGDQAAGHNVADFELVDELLDLLNFDRAHL